MKIAFISDVHSNYEALKTVLEDIQKRDVQQVQRCLERVV